MKPNELKPGDMFSYEYNLVLYTDRTCRNTDLTMTKRNTQFMVVATNADSNMFVYVLVLVGGRIGWVAPGIDNVKMLISVGEPC